jgi:hypothetical protein
MTYLPGDIFLIASPTIMGRLIRFFTRSPGEPPTRVNHVGLVVGKMIDDAVIIEALTAGVKVGRISRYAGRKVKVAVYRPLNLTPSQIRKIMTRACASVGRGYGFLKVFVRVIDWIFGARGRISKVLFLKSVEDCGWLVAHAYLAAGKAFGLDAKAATPDDIWDFVTSEPEKFTCVKQLDTM